MNKKKSLYEAMRLQQLTSSWYDSRVACFWYPPKATESKTPRLTRGKMNFNDRAL